VFGGGLEVILVRQSGRSTVSGSGVCSERIDDVFMKLGGGENYE
jgi:hypothetical protein